VSDNPFLKAVKVQALLRLALTGPSGSGKTYTALLLATTLIPDAKVAVIDTERGSASKYADLFDFDVVELSEFNPAVYVRALECAQEHGYNVVVMDTISHAWAGTGGVLEIVDNVAAKSKNPNKFAAWNEGTKVQNKFIDAILDCPMHVIATMRSKMDHVQETNTKTGKMEVRKVGMAPIQRDGIEYEFDVVADMQIDNTMIVTKSRCPQLHEKVIAKPDAKVSTVLRTWLNAGEQPPPVTKPVAATTDPTAATGEVTTDTDAENAPVTAQDARSATEATEQVEPQASQDSAAENAKALRTPGRSGGDLATYIPRPGDDGYDPALDNRVFTKPIAAEFSGWLLTSELADRFNHANHPGNAVLLSLIEAELIGVKTWAAVYKAKITVALAWDALRKHYAAKVEA